MGTKATPVGLALASSRVHRTLAPFTSGGNGGMVRLRCPAGAARSHAHSEEDNTTQIDMDKERRRRY
jgi:hypothetical protein